MAEPAAGYGAGDDLFEWKGLREDEEELALDEEYAARHLHTAAQRHRAAAKNTRAAGDEEVAARRLVTAQDYLAMAKRIVPNCVEISILLAKVLLLASKDDEAKDELLRAIGIPNPILSSGLPIVSSGDPFVRKTEDQRAENCTQRARISLRVCLDWICSNSPGVVWKVLQGYWNSLTSEKRGSLLSVRLDELHKYYDEVYQDDHWAASTISDALSFVKQTGSWRFLICPYCIGEKLPDAKSLLGHMRSEHPAEEDLMEVCSGLEPKLIEDDDSLDEIAVSQDSEDHYFFHFKKIDRMFQNLAFMPTRISIADAKSFGKTRDEKCKEGTKLLEEMNQKSKTLDTDNSSAEFHKACFELPDLWDGFLANSTLDYRVVILPLAKSFLWAELVKSMIEDNAEPDTEMVSPNVYAPGNIAIGEHILKLSNGNKAHKGGHDQQADNLKPSRSDETLKLHEKCEEREVCVGDKNSGTMVNQNLTGPPIYHDKNGKWRVATGLLKKAFTGTSRQFVKEMESTCSSRLIGTVFRESNDDEDLSILHPIMQALCNLRHFREKFIAGQLVWNPSNDNPPCIAGIFYGIFYALERKKLHLTVDVLTSVKNILQELVDDSSIHGKFQVGRKFSSRIMTTILNRLHMSENSSSSGFNREIRRQVANHTCGDCICPTHNIFGIKFNVEMSCHYCGKSFHEGLYTTLFHKLDAGSPQTRKVKSFADLPILLDEHFCKENCCEHFGSLDNTIDLFLSNEPHYLTIVLNWEGGSESQDTLYDVLTDITSPHRTDYFCRVIILQPSILWPQWQCKKEENGMSYLVFVDIGCPEFISCGAICQFLSWYRVLHSFGDDCEAS